MANPFGYIGPETILPATSLLAAVGGIVLAFWSWVAGAVVKTVRFVLRRPAPAPAGGETSPAAAPAAPGAQS